MSSTAAEAAQSFDAQLVAQTFVEARLMARALPGFPGPLPAGLAEAYAVQDIAIGLWPDQVIGWKVGRIPLELQASLGAARVMGPVFARNVWNSTPGEPVRLPVIPGGFAAVEAEYVFRIGKDAPAGKVDWTAEEAEDLPDAMFAGVELAGSPLATINVLGPRVVGADFGNNAALVLGNEIVDWRERTDDIPPCAAYVAGELAGQGTTASVPGGPASSLAFLAGMAARRGYPLKRGQYVTTGAASGIHEIEAGQPARITFGDLDEIHCIAVVAEARED